MKKVFWIIFIILCLFSISRPAMGMKFNPISEEDAASLVGTIDGDRLPSPTTTKKGGVPATGTPSGKFLKDDGTWAAGAGGAAWGDISGTLSAQTDLSGALDGKAPSLGADDNYVTDAEKTALHSQNTDTDLDATFEASLKNTDNHTSGTTNKVYTATEQSKLAGIATGAQVNNISDVNATDLTDGGATTLHSHAGSGSAFPVDSVFIAVVNTNPNTLLGYGTWSAIGAGRVLVGLDSGDANFDTVEETGGAKTVQSSAQTFTGTQSTVIVNHTHDVNIGSANDISSTTGAGNIFAGTTSSVVATTGNPKTGGAASYTPVGTNTPGAATSVVQPYLVVYIWKRTA